MGFFDSFAGRSYDLATDKNWNAIAQPTHLATILAKSEERLQLIYKHSHRCSICIMAREELQKAAKRISNSIDLYFLNVVNQREISDHISSELGIRHESPQVIMMKHGEVIWHGSHWEIQEDKIIAELSDLLKE
ncbi:MAG: bacillithiol system redox-active protein YtxJ [Balneolaceae bacterium]|jgi:bacillithiol system protein YtxJ